MGLWGAMVAECLKDLPAGLGCTRFGALRGLQKFQDHSFGILPLVHDPL